MNSTLTGWLGFLTPAVPLIEHFTVALGNYRHFISESKKFRRRPANLLSMAPLQSTPGHTAHSSKTVNGDEAATRGPTVARLGV